MTSKRKLTEFVTHSLLATRHKSRRWLVWIECKARMVDIRKPVHAVIIGVIVAGLVVPAFDYLHNESRYRLQTDQLKVVGHLSKSLGDRLTYDQKEKAIFFNREGQSPAGDQNLTRVGVSEGKQMYSAKMPVQASSGLKFTDTTHKMSATMSPQYGLMDGRRVDGRVIYPLQDGNGVLALTPKGNGIKEDIVLDHSDADRVQYDYKLGLEEGLEARLEANGAVGVYSADPALFGNITYSTDADRARVEKARKNAEKNYLMFEIPAPVVKQADGRSHGVKAHFMLKGDTLSVVTTGLSKASYPLSIDPSFVITTQSDFLLGKVEDNITLTITSGSDAQLNRAKITAGVLGSWGTAVAGNLPTTGGAGGTGCSETGGVNFNFGLTAYNGFLYLVGGGNGAGRFVCYAALNANGTLGAWTPTTTSFAQGRIGSTVVGFNGYIYVLNGEDSTGNTQYKNVDFAPVTSSGDITATWTSSTSYYTGTVHTFGGGVTYNGFIYMCGGATIKKDTGLIATCEYTQINSDGTLQRPTTSCTLSGTATNWCGTTSFNTARNRFGMAVYNGYIYIVGGYNGVSPITTPDAVQYVSIAPDYSLGAWNSTTSFTSIAALSNGWRNGGVVAEQGHLYMVGGCTTAPACGTSLNGTYYAVINADGTIGPWDTSSTSFTTARFFNGVASYNGVIYSIGGCTVEPVNANNCTTALGDSQYAVVNTTPGDTTGPTANNGGSLTAARAGIATVAYNGWLYAAGGCNGTNCGTYVATVDVAKVNDDGSLGAWAATNALPAATGMNAGRTFGTMVGYGGKLYYIGGLQKTTGAVDNYASNVLVGTQTASTGALTWVANNTASDAFTNGRAYHASAAWGNYIYVMGGTNGTNYYNDVQYTKIVNGTLTDPNSCGGGTTVWCSTSSFGSTGTAGLGAAAYAGYIYVAGGRSSANAAITAVYRAPITTSTGALGSFSTDTSLPSGPHRYNAVVIHNNVIYSIGGMTDAAGNAPSNVVSCASLDGSTGAVGAWTTCTRTLAAARWAAGAAAYNGRLFVVGGCTSTGAPPCTAYAATTEFMLVRNGGNGMFGTTAANANPWTSTSGCTGACTLTARADAQTVAYNGNLYVIGGCTTYSAGVCTAISTKVEHAAISASGSLGSFSSASDTQLSSGQARMYGSAIAYVGRLFLFGGSSSTNADTADVISAPLSATGNVGAWRAETSMPEARHGFGAALSSGRVYVAGGINGSTLKNSAMYSEIGENGLLINWITDASTFTTARQDLSVLAYNGKLYAIGGYDGSNIRSDVQFAPINTDGSLGTWKFTNEQDQKGRFRQAAAANGYMYFFGSESSGLDVFYAAINSNGTIGSVYRASNSGMIATSNHAHGGVVFSDGFFYAVGGCTLSGSNCTTVNNGAEYAGQKAQARIGHYSKMFNTEVNTAPSLVQVNGSGQFVVTMRTAAVGTTTWGVPQFISPAYATKFYFLKALDGTGTDVGIAFNYYLFLIIDDSNTGAFPDTGSVAADVDIYYHPNPTRRLRHGASFTNTGCNRVVADGCLLDTAE